MQRMKTYLWYHLIIINGFLSPVSGTHMNHGPWPGGRYIYTGVLVLPYRITRIFEGYGILPERSTQTQKTIRTDPIDPQCVLASQK